MNDNIRVIVRVRPLLTFEDQPAWIIKDNSIASLKVLNDKINLKGTKMANKSDRQIDYYFNFEEVINQNATSQQIYNNRIRQTLLQSFTSCKNLGIMAYGQTCSGKTYTILGIKQRPGILPCVLRELFTIKQNRKCSLKVSYLEIYNQKINDLLQDNKGQSLKITWDQKWGWDPQNTKESINSFEQAISLLQRGEKKRQYGQGEHHERSSRSHTLFKIFVQEWDINLCSKCFAITIADLAGSQRLQSQMQSSLQTGHINKSLFQLTNVISKLADQKSHIPFRDSKITRLLENSLTGRGFSLMICCVSPSSNCFNQTLSTLRLADKAKGVKLISDQPPPISQQIGQLKEALRLKDEECKHLQKQLSKVRHILKTLQDQIKSKGSEPGITRNQSYLKGDLLILLDHQNITLFLNGKMLQVPQLNHIKQNFLSQMQQIYQNYAHQIFQLCYGDKFELQIEQICFMNMILEHQKVKSYRLDIIEELLAGKDTRNDKFYSALQQYKNKLNQETHTYRRQSIQIKQFVDPSYKSLQQTSINHLSSQQISIHQSASLHLDTAKCMQQYGSYILVWGSKRDYRVCKGVPSDLSMISVSNLGKIKSVVCGYHHTLVITREGKLFGWGKNTQRQIIPIEKDSISSPTEICDIYGLKQVAAGWGHSLAITNDGQLYAWGLGKDGQLGLGASSRKKPTLVSHINSIKSVYAGHSHSAFIDSQNNVYSFGFNSDYRLMIGQQKTVLTPLRVPIRDAVFASLGVSHSAIITKSGLVFCGGVGTYGQLGVILNQSTPGWEKLEVVNRKFQQQPYQKICPLVQLEGLHKNNKAIKVCCGENMTTVLDDKRSVYLFGKTAGGTVANGKSPFLKILEGMDDISSGCRHSLALNKKQNKIYSWGFNIYGQANPGVAGDIQNPKLIELDPKHTIVDISCGFFHTALLLE